MTLTRGHMLLKLTVREDRGGWWADVPDILGCDSWGATRDIAVRHAREAAIAQLEDAIAAGDPRPASVRFVMDGEQPELFVAGR